MKKIIKSVDVVFFKDKVHLEDFPSGRLGEAPAIKVDISSKLDVKELEANGNVFERDEEPDIKDKVEANVLAKQCTCSNEASKLDASKKIATKPPPTLQYGNETMGNFRYPDRAHKRLKNG